MKNEVQEIKKGELAQIRTNNENGAVKPMGLSNHHERTKASGYSGSLEGKEKDKKKNGPRGKAWGKTKALQKSHESYTAEW